MKDDILISAIQQYGEQAQTDIVIEEFSELIKALLKYRRYSDSADFEIRATAIENVREEIVDCAIVLKQAMIIYGYSKKIEEKKLKRLKERIEKDRAKN